MTRKTSGWTEPAAVAGIGIAIAVGLAFAAAATNSIHPALVLIGSALVAMLATGTDAFGGIVVALFTGAGIAGAQFALVGLPAHGAPAWALLFALLLTLGALGGVVGDRIRRERRRTERVHGHAVMPAEGSLGLLGETDGRLRLAEEITRARMFARPLSAARVIVEISDESLSRADARGVRRAVARALENVLRVTDVPYALESGGFGVVLPETAPDAAADVVGSVLIAAAQSTFADRTAGARRRVGDVVRLQLGIVDAARVPSQDSRAVIEQAGATLRDFDPSIGLVRR